MTHALIVAEQLELVAEGWQPGVLILAGLRESASSATALAEMAGYLREKAGIDPLTGLDSQGRFESRLTQELKRAARSGHPTAVAIFELRGLDSLEAVDAAGAIVRASFLLQTELRDIDTVARLEGARFAALLPMCDAACGQAAVSRAVGVLSEIECVVVVGGVASTTESPGWDLLEAAELALAANRLPSIESRASVAV